MSCLVRVPAPLRSCTGGADRVEVRGDTIAEVLADLGRMHEPLLKKICGPDGNVRSFVNVYVNEVDIRRLGGTDAPVCDGDEILLVPAIAGG